MIINIEERTDNLGLDDAQKKMTRLQELEEARNEVEKQPGNRKRLIWRSLVDHLQSRILALVI